MLLDEVIYMEVRVFREFLRRFGMKAADAYHLFEENESECQRQNRGCQHDVNNTVTHKIVI